MAFNVRIEIPGRPSMFVASVAADDMLTTDRDLARNFIRSMNADEFAGKWERTLRALNVAPSFDVITEAV